MLVFFCLVLILLSDFFFSLVFEFFFVIHRDLLMQIITFVFLFFALFLL